MSVEHLAQRRWDVLPARKWSEGAEAGVLAEAAELVESVELFESVLVLRRWKGMDGRR